MREEIRLVPVGEAELYVEDVGPKDAPVLVTVHGGPGGSSHAFRSFLEEELSDYRVLYVDQRGSGKSPRLPEDPRLFTIDALVEDFEDLRHALGIERWTPLAQGFGAVVALEYARRFPAAVDGLVLVGPWVHFPWLLKRLWQAAAREPFPEDPEEAAKALFAEVSYSDLVSRLAFPTAHGRMHYEWVQDGGLFVFDDAVLRLFAENGLWRFDYTPYLLDLEHAPFVLVGDADGTSFPEQAEAVADLAGGELFVLEGAGHHPYVDDPEGFTEALYRALDAIHALEGLE